MIEDFWTDLKEGDIHVRDNLQFELKSEFFINPYLKQNVYKQDVFLFIPNALQINPQTYSKQQFYLDQTNLIRYKTPLITLANLINSHDSASPLMRLQRYLNQPEPNFFLSTASDEVKLFAAIFKATLRKQIYKFIQDLRQLKLQDLEKLLYCISLFCQEIVQVCDKFRQLREQAKILSHQQPLIRHFKYVDEFISLTIVEFLMILLKQLRSIGQQNSILDQQICQLVLKESSFQKHLRANQSTKRRFFTSESILYRQGLLNRFVLESLMLKHQRFSVEEKHTHLLGATAAGIAMFVYMGLFVWKFSGFVINSFPFVALVVFFYILKDRIKEGFKTLYYKQAYRWFPDYSTEISSPKSLKIGILKENFAFIERKQLPEEFLKIRNTRFHEELQALQRHETIIQYKREMILNPSKSLEGRRRELTTIFRLNIYRFLQKASNAFQPSLMLNTYTHTISKKPLPKVYHLNIIIRNTYLQHDLTPKVEIKTFRIVVNKNGIKRVEHIQSTREHDHRTS